MSSKKNVFSNICERWAVFGSRKKFEVSNFSESYLLPSIIFQWSRKVPVDWKLANVPVFKKGKKKDLSNYRFVSLTSVLGNIMKIILGVSEKHLEDNASLTANMS